MTLLVGVLSVVGLVTAHHIGMLGELLIFGAVVSVALCIMFFVLNLSSARRVRPLRYLAMLLAGTLVFSWNAMAFHHWQTYLAVTFIILALALVPPATRTARWLTVRFDVLRVLDSGGQSSD
ncbi:hypothetical protein [Nesterenkonia rhizosphaerae]|uniref:Uncharacterized protein n=1 Tax=Nesterenkonia rhizosphaerae TaxID=1348272 RepID=A0ABP9G085_9MICC